MKSLLKIIVLLVVLAVLAYAGFIVYRIVQERREISRTEKDQGPLKVAVQRIQTATLTKSASITGEVEALAVVDLVPKVTGRLERLRLPNDQPIEEGSVVEKGQVIVIVEHSALEAAVQSAKAAVEVAKASYERAKVDLLDCEREKTRWENLYKQGSATEQQRDKAVTAYERWVVGMKLAEAQIAQAEASLRQAQVNLDEATIAAPISGVISEKYVDEGNMVGPGKPLVRISQIDTVKVVGGLSERHLSALVPAHTPVWIAVDAYPDKEFKGVLYSMGVDIDRQTRTAKVELRIPNPDHLLKPGMFVRLNVLLDRKENVPVVPDTALLRQGLEVYVYAVNGSKAQRRVLKLGLSEGIYHEIIQGLEAGDIVIIKGQRLLSDGDEVDIVEEDEP